MIRVFYVILFLLITFAIALPLHLVEGAEKHRLMCEEGVYSKIASIPHSDNTEAITAEFPSPDGLKKIIIKDKPRSQPEVFVRIGEKEYLVEFSPWPCPEFQCAPDSKAFFLTYSEGEAVGNYEVRIYFPSEQGLEIVDPTSEVGKDFTSYYPKCVNPEFPNFGAIAWIKDSTRLLLAAEVLPHSNCEMMGTFAAYEIEIPSGKIVKKYGQLDAKKHFWGLLGIELRNANDDCFTVVGACRNPMLHEKQ